MWVHMFQKPVVLDSIVLGARGDVLWLQASRVEHQHYLHEFWCSYIATEAISKSTAKQRLLGKRPLHDEIRETYLASMLEKTISVYSFHFHRTGHLNIVMRCQFGYRHNGGPGNLHGNTWLQNQCQGSSQCRGHGWVTVQRLCLIHHPMQLKSSLWCRVGQNVCWGRCTVKAISVSVCHQR